MIVNKYNYGGGGSGSGVTPQEVQAQIDSALTYYWESGETKDYVDGAVSGISLDGYYTSAQTDEKIASAVTPVANHLAEVEQITASAYTELHDGLMEVSARTMPDMSLYTPTSGFSTINGSAITNGGNIVIQGGGGGDMSAYWTSAETQSAITSVSGNLQSQIDTMDTVVGDALIDLNARVLHTVKSTDDSIVNIVKIEQTAYNTLVSQSATSSTTLYIVVPDAQ